MRVGELHVWGVVNDGPLVHPFQARVFFQMLSVNDVPPAYRAGGHREPAAQWAGALVFGGHSRHSGRRGATTVLGKELTPRRLM